jgi:hypothetical protein
MTVMVSLHLCLCCRVVDDISWRGRVVPKLYQCSQNSICILKFWIRETGMVQKVGQLNERYIMMKMK